MTFTTAGGHAPTADRRKSRRWLARARCSLRVRDGAARSVTLWNISEGGFGARCPAHVRDGDEVTLRLGRTGHADALVVWRKDDRMGCKFLRPVSAAEVALALATASPIETDRL